MMKSQKASNVRQPSKNTTKKKKPTKMLLLIAGVKGTRADLKKIAADIYLQHNLDMEIIESTRLGNYVSLKTHTIKSPGNKK